MEIESKNSTSTLKKNSITINEVRHLVTLDCMYRCAHCYNSAGEHSETATYQFTQEEIDRFYHFFKPESVSATGGEPLLEYDLVKKIAKSIESYGGALELVSNGFLLTPSIIDELNSINSKTFYQISLDGLKDYHDYIRGYDGAFEKAINAIDYASSTGRVVKARMTLTEKNYDQVSKVIFMLDDFRRNNIKLVIRPVVNYGRALVNNLKSGIHSFDELDHFVKLPKYISVDIISRCGYCTDSVAVIPNGDIYECCYLLLDREYYIGNILDDLGSMSRNPEFIDHRGKCYVKDKQII